MGGGYGLQHSVVRQRPGRLGGALVGVKGSTLLRRWRPDGTVEEIGRGGHNFGIGVGAVDDDAFFQRRHRNTVAEHDPVARLGRHSLAGGDDADQVQRIAGRNDFQSAGGGGAVRFPQRGDGVGQGKLFADETGDEPPAPISPLASSRR